MNESQKLSNRSSDPETIDQTRRLACEQGIVAGYTTGANGAAALKLAATCAPNDVVVTVACDTGMKYLSGDLFV